MGFFLWLSDLHLDPLYGTQDASNHKNGDDCKLPFNATLRDYPYGRFGCDSPPLLLESSLQSAKENSLGNKDPLRFILVTGDFARHSTDAIQGLDNPIAFTESVLSTSIATIRSHFPGVSVVPALGNNDLVPDYYLDTTEISQENKTNTLLGMVGNGFQEAFLSEEEARTFALGGYFSRVIEISHSSSILVLSLNTVVYSVRHEPEPTIVPDENDDDPLGQFDWIESQLERAATGATIPIDNNRTITAVYVVGHIPPSIGSYRHSQLWHERYVDRYVSILKDYYYQSKSDILPPPIMGNMFGHVHTEEFRLLSYGTDDDQEDEKDEETPSDDSSSSNKDLVLPILVTASLTPIYGSNPSYRIVEYNDDSGALLDYTTYYLDLDGSKSSSSWTRLPSFAEVFNVSDLSSSSLGSVIRNLEEEHEAFLNRNSTPTPLWDTFLNRQRLYAKVADDGDDSNRKKGDVMVDWLCTFTATSKDNYTNCLLREAQIETSHTAVVYLILSNGIMIMGVLAMVFGMRAKKRARRREYHRPDEGEDGVVVIDDTNIPSTSKDISMVVIKHERRAGELT